MEKLKNIHPGEVLLEEFLKPLNVSAYRLSKETLIPQTRVSEILKEKEELLLTQPLDFQNSLVTQQGFS